MIDSRDFDSFKLVHGDLFKSKAEALVIPVHSMESSTGGGVLLRKARERFPELEFKRPKHELDDFSAHLIDLKEKKVVIVACYVGRDRVEEAAKSARNALEKAKDRVDSIAFPLLTVGIHGGVIKDVLPVLKEQFDDYGDEFKDIYLYVYEGDDYDYALELLGVKTEKELSREEEIYRKLRGHDLRRLLDANLKMVKVFGLEHVKKTIDVVVKRHVENLVELLDKHYKEILSIKLIKKFISKIKGFVKSKGSNRKELRGLREELKGLEIREKVVNEFVEGLVLVFDYLDLLMDIDSEELVSYLDKRYFKKLTK